MSAPWYSHLVTGAVVILAGLALVHEGQPTEGATLVGAGAAFLGVGAGAALGASTPSVVSPTVTQPKP